GVRAGRAVAVCWTASLALVCVWPWAPHRVLTPLLPLTTAYLVRVPRWIGGGACAILVAANIAALCTTPLVHSRQASSVASHSGQPVAWSSYESLFGWLRENTDPDDVLVSEVDPMLYLYTGRRGMFPVVCPPQSRFYDLPVPTDNHDVPLRILAAHRPRFLVLTPYFLGEPDFDNWVADLRRRFGQYVREVYRVPNDPRFVVYRLDFPLDDSPREGTIPK